MEAPGNIPWSLAWSRQTVPQALAGAELQDVPLGPLLRVGCAEVMSGGLALPGKLLFPGEVHYVSGSSLLWSEEGW